MTSIPTRFGGPDPVAEAPADHGHDHPPHLAHHFDTPVQQYASGKLGMWTFLGTEVLMFGGLFVAYAVYRYIRPDVFIYAHQYLNTTLGLINTIVLLASSLTMAMAVHFIQKGNKAATLACLLITLGGGFGFMGIKSVEYYEKLSTDKGPGIFNVYSQEYTGEKHVDEDAPTAHGGEHTTDPGEAEAGATGVAEGAVDAMDTGDDPHDGPAAGDGEHDEAQETQYGAGGTGTELTPDELDEAGTPVEQQPKPDLSIWGPEYVDPLANTPDALQIVPQMDAADSGTVAEIRNGLGTFAGNHNAQNREYTKHGDLAFGPAAAPDEHLTGSHYLEFGDLAQKDKDNVSTFYGIYYAMTGLHGLHVLIGMGLIGWVALKTAAGTFGPTYFTPVDLVGLYWHLVDLIWIFLFPLLYLIH